MSNAPKATFTTGPWFRGVVSETDGQYSIPITADGGFGYPTGPVVIARADVVMSRCPYPSARAEAEANARLIAAAPDLYAACEAVLVRLDIEYNERTARGDSTVFPCSALREVLRSALSAVRGD